MTQQSSEHEQMPHQSEVRYKTFQNLLLDPQSLLPFDIRIWECFFALHAEKKCCTISVTRFQQWRQLELKGSGKATIIESAPPFWDIQKAHQWAAPILKRTQLKTFCWLSRKRVFRVFCFDFDIWDNIKLGRKGLLWRKSGISGGLPATFILQVKRAVTVVSEAGTRLRGGRKRISDCPCAKNVSDCSCGRVAPYWQCWSLQGTSEVNLTAYRDLKRSLKQSSRCPITILLINPCLLWSGTYRPSAVYTRADKRRRSL